MATNIILWITNFYGQGAPAVRVKQVDDSTFAAPVESTQNHLPVSFKVLQADHFVATFTGTAVASVVQVGAIVSE